MAKRKPSKRSKKKRLRACKPSTPVWRDLTGIALLTAAIMAAVAVLSYVPTDPPNGSSREVLNLLGPAGAHLAHTLIYYTFGRWLALVLPLLVMAAGLDLLLARGMRLSRLIDVRALILSTLAVTIWGVTRNMMALPDRVEPIGLIGWGLKSLLLGALGNAGSIIVLIAVVLMTATVMLRIQWVRVGRALLDGLRWIGAQLSRLPSPKELKLPSLPKKTLVPLRREVR